MKIALIGATGNAGSRILAEALSRGHTVTALVRDPSKLKTQAGLAVKSANVFDPETLAPVLAGQDALISAFTPPRGTPDYAKATLAGVQSILQAAQKARIPRFLIVGGAGSLLVAEGVQLVDTPNFPAEYKVEAGAMRDVYAWLGREAKLDWVYAAPPAYFAPGARTGKYRVGHRYLLSDAEGKSAISMEDFAVALIDEVELPAHHRERFTVAN